MPTYTYQCKKCEAVQDVFHSMSESPRVKCDSCGSTRTTRLLGTGAGILFKGSGFYETDYKKSGNGKNGGASESKSEGKSETKAESKSESKPAKSDSGKSASAKGKDN
ncbi:MAG: zinc ribbon domain-containing protein [Candidatus Hydrogenedentes bacterium]|nr:zinc ribbon domain-containing protein [Candidatus Hydrogenedentota bacterium]